MNVVYTDKMRDYLAKQGNEGDLTVLVSGDQLDLLAVAVKAKLADSLRQRVTLAPSKALANGFKLVFSGEDVVYDFSDEALTEAISAHLSPALGAILMKG